MYFKTRLSIIHPCLHTAGYLLFQVAQKPLTNFVKIQYVKLPLIHISLLPPFCTLIYHTGILYSLVFCIKYQHPTIRGTIPPLRTHNCCADGRKLRRTQFVCLSCHDAQNAFKILRVSLRSSPERS